MSQAHLAKKCVIFLLDGFGPEYVSWEDMPALRRLRDEGAHTLRALGVLPSLTNVNHVSLLTGCFPERHGLTGNYFLDPASGQEAYMDRARYIQEKLLFEGAQAEGLSTMLVTAKEKLSRLLDRGLDICVDATSSPAELMGELGESPSIYSAEIAPWLLRAAKVMLGKACPDLAYIATTDYMEHKFGPQEPLMRSQAREMDRLIGEIVSLLDLSETLVVVAADHGMNQKPKAVSVPNVLERARVRAQVIPAIRDGLYAHHRDLGGAVYVYLEDGRQTQEARAILEEAEGVAEVVLAGEVGRLHLPPGAVGDMLVLGEKDWALGTWEGDEMVQEVMDLRSHGSRYEQEVPLFLAGAGVKARVALASARLVDIAPTVSRLMGLEAGAFQGRVLAEALC